MLQSPTDTATLRQALGAFATGVTIVTAQVPETGELVGFTANSFASVSLTPPLVLVCLAHTASSYNAFCATGSFAVNVLAAEQEATARRFATRGIDKFAATDWQPGAQGAPIISGCLAVFDCAVHERMTAGDHDILIGRVIGFSRTQGQALVYHGGAFAQLG